MKWQDKGIVVSLKKYGENSLILNLFTENHGLHAGLVKYSNSKKNRSVFQIGNIFNIEWTGRLEDQLGYYKTEIENTISHYIINNHLKIDALITQTSLINKLLADRQVHSSLFLETLNFIFCINKNEKFWIEKYIKWELKFLSELGFGLDLNNCAVTGSTNNLQFVSPKSGRAVSLNGAGKWKKKLFPLPNFFLTKNINNHDKSELLKGINITTYFLNQYVSSIGLKLPDIRDRFTNKLLNLNEYSKSDN
ncbi:MAG: DNA repair protein RecO [Pelagibacterales bacterium]|nr:DNA repair protein RecO [Pelagibacterales bacterium]PPR16389.1 MAG: DNA repair protein RecO [Alphaproteobacteria bacterium MarineAlpha9_Bin3]|tara:strand:+ start:2263 stop:3012 length:750 start_codon:yes stop_codon:yes gene_type:complete